MEKTMWMTAIGGIALLFIARRLLREYIISRALQRDYQAKLKKVLTSPDSQVKGRFE